MFVTFDQQPNIASLLQQIEINLSLIIRKDRNWKCQQYIALTSGSLGRLFASFYILGTSEAFI